MFLTLLYYETIKRPMHNHGWLYFGLFLCITLLFFVIAIGADGLSGALSRAILWVALLLAAMLSMQDICSLEAENGALQQIRRFSMGMEQFLLARLAGQWVISSITLMLILPVIAPMLSLGEDLSTLRLIVGHLGMLSICMLASNLSRITPMARFLMPVIVLPIAIPLLILGIGEGSMMSSQTSLPLLIGVVLVLVPVAIIASGAALRVSIR